MAPPPTPPTPPTPATNFPALHPHPTIGPTAGLTVCVVIPCVPRHLQHLPDVLQSVDEQTEPAVHVVVALSETDGDECAFIVAKLHARTITPLTLSCVATPVVCSQSPCSALHPLRASSAHLHCSFFCSLLDSCIATPVVCSQLPCTALHSLRASSAHLHCSFFCSLLYSLFCSPFCSRSRRLRRRTPHRTATAVRQRPV